MGRVFVDFQTHPSRYRHWKLSIDPPLAFLAMDVDEHGGLDSGYELKLNSYDLGVDVELYDATQRLRFEHPEVGGVVITSALDRVFCAGANIRMLGQASHPLKVNFCKFTNETRNAIEDAGAHSGQRYLAAINGNAAGGGYELALACDHLILADDGSSSVAMPEVPLLAVLPGTGGLTRLTDKRNVRRDRADVFCTLEEGVKGRRAVDWGLVDEIVPTSRFPEVVRERALELATKSDRPAAATGVDLTPLDREFSSDGVTYRHLRVDLDRTGGTASLAVNGPSEPPPTDVGAAVTLGAGFWPLALARELDDALLHLRLNEPETGLLLLRSQGDPGLIAAYDEFLIRTRSDWLIREIVLLWKRTLKRLDLGARTAFCLVEPGSCFVGLLAELVLAADRSYMFEGSTPKRPAPVLRLTEMNFGLLPMANGLSRLETRFWGKPDLLEKVRSLAGVDLSARQAEQAELVTFALDAIDWDHELRIAIEERASFSPDSLSGLEANLRFAGPETMETKIFGRLSAWQNWIFSRPNASGEQGALRRYGTGSRPTYDRERT